MTIFRVAFHIKQYPMVGWEYENVGGYKMLRKKSERLENMCVFNHVCLVETRKDEKVEG